MNFKIFAIKIGGQFAPVLGGQFTRYLHSTLSNTLNSFGSIMEGRNYEGDTSLRYRFGFNDKEKDNEIYGDGNCIAYEARIYNSRLGRFLSKDPLEAIYPDQSPFAYCYNNPVTIIDVHGMGADPVKNSVKSGQTLWGVSKDYYNKNKSSIGGTWESYWKDVQSWNKGGDYGKIGGTMYLSDPKPASTASCTPVSNNAPTNDNYNKGVSKAIEKNSVKMMIMGLSSFGNHLYGSSGDPTAIFKINEEQKQQFFKANSDKTLGILFFEFVEGVGCETREFDESHAITKDIKFSRATNIFASRVRGLIEDGKIKDGVQYKTTVYTSPDNSPFSTWTIQLLQLKTGNNAAFFTGSLDYYFTVHGTTINVMAQNQFSVSSGITRDHKDDFHRIPNARCPLGSTNQIFNFKIQY